jgi:ethanolamine permease
LFVLRRKQPDLERPFKVPLYPWFPGIALILAIVCLIAIVWYNLLLSFIFFGALALLMILFVVIRRSRS